MINIRTPQNIIKYNIINEVLSTHNLSDDDRKYGITFIGNLEITLDDIFFKFLLYTNKKTFIGLFAHSYNDYFDDAIKTKDSKVLKNMASEITDNVFFELGNNKLILDEDKQQVQKILDYEYRGIKSAVEYALAKNDVQSNILTGDNSLYSQELGKFLKADKGIAIYPNYCNIIYLIDNVKNSKHPKIFSFVLWDLLNIVILNNLNPQTNEPFSPQVYNNLIKKYELELKLVSRYLKSKK